MPNNDDDDDDDNSHFVANFLLSMLVKEFWKLISI